MVAPIAVATLGNYLGACTTCLILRAAVRRPEAPGTGGRALALFRRFGAPVLLLSWVPIIGDALVALAGGARIGFAVFSLWVVLGKAARYAVVAWLARYA